MTSPYKRKEERRKKGSNPVRRVPLRSLSEMVVRDVELTPVHWIQDDKSVVF